MEGNQFKRRLAHFVDISHLQINNALNSGVVLMSFYPLGMPYAEINSSNLRDFVADLFVIFFLSDGYSLSPASLSITFHKSIHQWILVATLFVKVVMVLI